MSRSPIRIVALLFVAGGVCFAAASMWEDHLNGLRSADLKEREATADKIRKEHNELVRDLIGLAGQHVRRVVPEDPASAYPWHDSKHLAMLLLGELRAPEAVPVLVENIEYRNPRTLFVSYFDMGALYPAAEALSKIGMPAIGPTIDKLSAYDKDGSGRLTCCSVIKSVLRDTLGRVRLEIAIEEARDPTAKKNLTAALSYFYFKTPEEKAAEERAANKRDK